MKLIYEALILTLSFLIVWFFKQSGLESLTGAAIGVLIAIYVLSNLRKKEKSEDTLHIFLLTTTILFLIGTTGGLSSFLFFLFYFVIFAIGFVMNPKSVFTFALLAVIFFLPDTNSKNFLQSLIQLGSILLISPLAYFFSEEYKNKEQKELIADKAAKNITKDVETILEEQKDTITQKEKDALKDILIETAEIKK